MRWTYRPQIEKFGNLERSTKLNGFQSNSFRINRKLPIYYNVLIVIFDIILNKLWMKRITMKSKSHLFWSIIYRFLFISLQEFIKNIIYFVITKRWTNQGIHTFTHLFGKSFGNSTRRLEQTRRISRTYANKSLVIVIFPFMNLLLFLNSIWVFFLFKPVVLFHYRYLQCEKVMR